ncbi:hypothetical protein BKA80DRAFT_279759, partial [Phyllosticta citrichinensis]
MNSLLLLFLPPLHLPFTNISTPLPSPVQWDTRSQSTRTSRAAWSADNGGQSKQSWRHHMRRNTVSTCPGQGVKARSHAYSVDSATTVLPREALNQPFCARDPPDGV